MSTTVPQDITAPVAPAAARRLRLWPGVVILALMWAGVIVPQYLDVNPYYQFMAKFLAPEIGLALVALWWLFASRIRWTDRLIVLAAFAGAAVGSWFCLHHSFQMAFMLYGLPAVVTAWVGWLILAQPLSWPVQRAGLLGVFILVWGGCALLRMDGVDGGFGAEMSWRWTPTAEEKFLAQQPAKAVGAPDTTAVTLAPGDWPGFRGPQRDGRLTGVRVATDWTAHPPMLVWKHRVGPGWSSFAVVGDHLYTQEQRGDNEAVVCYRASDGQVLWQHEDPVRFSEDIAGPGPRATPTFHEGKLYTLGAKGLLNCLDPATGKAIWSKDVAADSGAKVPQWGFSASPLVAAGIVTVYTGGPDGKAVLGYKADTGDLAWAAAAGPNSYCSTQLAKIDGVEQVLIVTDAGLTAFDPATGKVLWNHDWLVDQVVRVTQPAVLDGDDVLIGTPFGVGTRRVHVAHKGDAWSTAEVWTTKAIKPYFNDLVIYKDHLYGFDGQFFLCVGLADGKQAWKARGYGAGQVLLADQGVLLIASEKGEAALVAATPERHQELGKFQAIEGKTWNHPVLAHGRLYVRNGEEAACYQLAEEGEKVAGR